LNYNLKPYTLSKYKYFLFIIALLMSCSLVDTVNEQNGFIASYDMSQLTVSDLFAARNQKGVLQNKQINEVSGMVASHQDSSLFWVHNDSGDESRIFLINEDGTHLGTYPIDNATNRDWEDIAYGPGPEDDIKYIYIAEIGDNYARYDLKHIYRFPEPNLALQQDNTITQTERISFVFPEGIKMDAETLLLDPWTKDIFIVTKREFPATVYRLPYPQSTTDTIVAEIYGRMPFTSATGGDISADGKEILIKTYDSVFLWSREEEETLSDAFMRAPQKLDYTPEPQGEAIAFSISGNGYYTLSEMRNDVTPVIYFYKRNRD